jgi:hypothetical protein
MLDTSLWRRQRKKITAFFNTVSLEEHLPTQHAESVQLINDLLDDSTVCTPVFIFAY